MILDERTEFADGLDISQAGDGTTVLGDVIDLEVARDIGNGREIFWYVSCDEDGAGGTSANFQLTSADNAALTTNPTVHAQTGVITLADIGQGKMLYMATVPLEGPEYKRYLGVRQVVVGTFTAGQVSTGLTLDPRGWKAYPEGLN